MNTRITRIVLSLIVGSIGVAIGLYLGWLVAVGLQLVRVLTDSAGGQPSREATALVTDVTRWVFLGLLCGLGLALTGVSRHRVRFVVFAILGFAAGGALASLLVVTSLNRTSPAAMLGVPLGGAVAGLLLGFGARLGVRSVALLVVVAVALLIGGQFIDPRSDFVLPSPLSLTLADWIALLVPGALIGAALAAWTPDGAAATAPA